MGAGGRAGERASERETETDRDRQRGRERGERLISRLTHTGEQARRQRAPVSQAPGTGRSLLVSLTKMAASLTRQAGGQVVSSLANRERDVLHVKRPRPFSRL